MTTGSGSPEQLLGLRMALQEAFQGADGDDAMRRPNLGLWHAPVRSFSGGSRERKGRPKNAGLPKRAVRMSGAEPPLGNWARPWMKIFIFPHGPIGAQRPYRNPALTPDTAYHEAGHIVFAHLTGICIAVKLTGEHTATQAAAIYDRRHDLAAARARGAGNVEIDYALEEAIIAAAGYVAQERYRQCVGATVSEDELFRDAHGDVLAVRAALGPLRWFEVCDKARSYLAQPGVWQAIERVAEAALQRGALSESQLDTLLHSADVDFDLPTGTVLR